MNNITNLQAQIVAKDAELQALYAGIGDLINYVESDKFRPESRGGSLVEYVNVNDVVIRLREVQGAATDALHAAYLNEHGPRIADGSHTGCSHGTAAGVPRVNGWHCPVCGEPLPGEWNDTDARAAERMRKHWVDTHRRTE